MIWATRGRDWGFRFLERGGFGDPLPVYDGMFNGAEGQPNFFRRIGDRVAVRFPDPLGRKDSAGRVIPHEFVFDPPVSEEIDSIEAVLKKVWSLPEVSGRYAELWAKPARDVR